MHCPIRVSWFISLPEVQLVKHPTLLFMHVKSCEYGNALTESIRSTPVFAILRRLVSIICSHHALSARRMSFNSSFYRKNDGTRLLYDCRGSKEFWIGGQGSRKESRRKEVDCTFFNSINSWTLLFWYSFWKWWRSIYYKGRSAGFAYREREA